jgi:molybdopterin-guanine dinucleotide biosynthesis protein A
MLTVAIQAGGKSSRMGQNKALVPFLGRPLIQRVVDRVRPLSGDILVTTNDPEDFTFLGLPLFPDVMPGSGALGGLLTALTAAQQPFVAVVACDMPFVNSNLLKLEIDLVKNLKVDAVVPESGEGYEPFHAVYRREPCLAAIRAALDAGQRRMISWFPLAQVHILSAEQVRAIDPMLRAFENINTPEELEQAESTARQAES